MTPETDEELVEHLRRVAAIWFKNADLILLEDFIRRFERLKTENARKNAVTPT